MPGGGEGLTFTPWLLKLLLTTALNTQSEYNEQKRLFPCSGSNTSHPASRQHEVFYGEEMSAPCPTPKLKDHPLLTVHSLKLLLLSSIHNHATPQRQRLHLTWTITTFSSTTQPRKGIITIQCAGKTCLESLNCSLQ